MTALIPHTSRPLPLRPTTGPTLPWTSTARARLRAPTPLPSRSLSRMAGHVLLGTDRCTPLEGARVMVEGLDVLANGAGLYEVGLDDLPAEVTLIITAPGYHSFCEVVNRASIASGGLILRDFYLWPAHLDLVAAPLADVPPEREWPTRGDLAPDLEESDADELLCDDEQGDDCLDHPSAHRPINLLEDDRGLDALDELDLEELPWDALELDDSTGATFHKVAEDDLLEWEEEELESSRRYSGLGQLSSLTTRRFMQR